MTALHFLALASVRYSLDFAGLAKGGECREPTDADFAVRASKLPSGANISSATPQTVQAHRLNPIHAHLDIGTESDTTATNLSDMLTKEVRPVKTASRFDVSHVSSLASSELAHNDAALDLLFYGDDLGSINVSPDDSSSSLNIEDIADALDKLFFAADASRQDSNNLDASPNVTIMQTGDVESRQPPSRGIINDFEATMIYATA